MESLSLGNNMFFLSLSLFSVLKKIPVLLFSRIDLSVLFVLVDSSLRKGWVPLRSHSHSVSNSILFFLPGDCRRSPIPIPLWFFSLPTRHIRTIYRVRKPRNCENCTREKKKKRGDTGTTGGLSFSLYTPRSTQRNNGGGGGEGERKKLVFYEAFSASWWWWWHETPFLHSGMRDWVQIAMALGEDGDTEQDERMMMRERKQQKWIRSKFKAPFFESLSQTHSWKSHKKKRHFTTLKWDCLSACHIPP